MKTTHVALLALAIGGALGFSANHLLGGHFSAHDMNAHDMTANRHGNSPSSPSAQADSNEPLYWVAPMDPNYQRDKPGKSPMGMDLIPVYADDLAGNNKPGTVTIDPAVENNLGVKTALVEMAKLSPRIQTVGYIAFDESQLWQTNVRVAGWVEKLYINAVGEHVQKGDVLFTLYSPELVKAQEELLNARNSGRTGLVKGATERLVSLGVDRQQIKQILKRGKASQTIEVKALASGVIASLNIREGGYLSPSQAVISAGPLEQVWVDAEVFERQAHWMKSGSLASMTLDALPGQSWQGEIDYVYPILDPKTRTLRVRLKFANPNGELKPNMFANIDVQPQSDDAVLTVPSNAVIRSGGMTRVVLALGDGKYRSARIETGREAGDKIEVLAGLVAGDRIVTSAHFMLDSESSQSADLARINGVDDNDAPQERVWAKGEITDVMADHRMLTIHHQPVPEWDWPGMVMDFTLAEGVDMPNAQAGQTLDFEMQKNASGQYEITELKLGEQAQQQVWLSGDITLLMADFGMITLSHQAQPDWGWPAGEMNFTVSDDVDLSQLIEGDSIRFLVEKQGNDYLLKAIEQNGGQQ